MHALINKLRLYAQLMRIDKPIGVLLLLWPVLWALWIAGEGQPSIMNVIIFVLGAFLMRSAGCVINDFADRNIDKWVARTKNRPLTSGAVSAKEALILFFVLCSLSFLLVLQTNTQTIYLSFVAVLLASLYPFTKRWVMYPQFFLGAAFSWGIVMAFAAENKVIDWSVGLLYVAVLLWTIAYDTFYAMVDREDDLIIGVKSTAIWFGQYDRLITALLQISVVSLLLYLGTAWQFGEVYFLACFVTLLLFVYQQMLIKNYDKEKCFQAFLNNRWVGLIIFLGLIFSV